MDGPAEIAPTLRPLNPVGLEKPWKPSRRRDGEFASGDDFSRSWLQPRPERPGNLLTQLMLWARASLGGGAQRVSNPLATAVGPAAVDDLLQGLFDSLPEEVALVDERGLIIAVNAAWRAAPSVAPGGGGVGASYFDLCADLSPDLGDDTFRSRVADVQDGSSRGLTFLFLTGAGETLRPRQVRLRRIAAQGSAILIAFHEDAGGHAAGAAPSASADVLTAQDEERERIAMELHDSTSQHLAALGMGVARLRRIAGDSAQDVLEDMSRSVSEVVKEIRVLSFLMRPPGLERQPLEATARDFVRGFAARTGLRAQFSACGPIDEAAPGVQHAAFRILQEALSNAFRHAEATAVVVDMSLVAGELAIVVSDDGKGIAGLRDKDLSGVSLGVGIVGMQSRVGKLGGRLEITSEGGGTRIVAVLPAAPAQA